MEERLGFVFVLLFSLFSHLVDYWVLGGRAGGGGRRGYLFVVGF